jgi:isopentenyldiphosphate isomerase
MRQAITMQERLVAIAKHRLDRRIREQRLAALREQQQAAACAVIDQRGELILAQRAVQQQALVNSPEHTALHQHNLAGVRASLHMTVAQKKIAVEELVIAKQQRVAAQVLSSTAMKRMTKLERFAELYRGPPEQE